LHPSFGIVNDQRRTPSSFGYKYTITVGIVVNKSRIRKRQVDLAHIADTGRVSARDNVGWYSVAAAANATCDSRDCSVGGWKPQENKRYSIANRTASFQEARMSKSRASCFKCKAATCFDKVIQAVEHHAASWNRSRLRIER